MTQALWIYIGLCELFFFFFQAEDGIRDIGVTGVQTCALPILELPPRLRQHAPPDDGRPRRPRAGRGPPLHGRRGRVGLDRRDGHGRFRPPPPWHLAPCATRSHYAPPPKLRREAMLGHLGSPGRPLGRGSAPLRRPRPLGIFPRLIRRYGRPDPTHRQWRHGNPAFDHPDSLRRRPPRLPRRSYSRRQREEPPLPGRLLPPPQRPPEQEVLPPEPSLVETRHPHHAP